MILFYIFAGTVLIFVVLAIVSPLIRKIDAERVIRESNDTNNLSVIKKYRNEIDSDYKMGVISKSQFEKSISELEQRYINEMGDDEVGVYSQASNSLRTVIVLVFVLPIFASGLYLMLGNRGAIETERQIADSVSSITLDEFKTMTQKLSMHLKENPGDMTGWVMLGRAHFVLGQFREAVDAWRNPLKSDPGNIELKINMAEALVLLNDGGITAESSRLVQEILNVDPMHRKALAMAGGERFAAGDYIGSIAIWEKLLLIVGNDVGFAESIRKNIKEAKTRHEGKEKGLFVSGMVRLSPNIKPDFLKSGTVFVVLRSSADSGMPLAVERVGIKDLPYNFVLDQSRVMVPQTNLSDYTSFVVSSFLSTTGRIEDKIVSIVSEEITVVLGREKVELTLRDIKEGRLEE